MIDIIIQRLDAVLVISILIFFGLAETLSGFLTNSKRKKGDWIQEMLSFFALSTVIKPMIVGAVVIVGSVISPSDANLLTGRNLLLVLCGYLLIDDVLQYWYHRTAHQRPFLWKLHRAHHQAEEMGYFVSYRNAALYYFLMPNLWWIGLITFLGGGKAVALGLILKQLVIISSHSRLKWDKPFYHSKILRPFIQLIQRVIVTPAFHHAHHGRSRLDGVSNPNRNFGNMFSIWDQLFGTAQFRSAYPSEYGLHTKTDDPWTASYLFPIIKSKDPASELAPEFTKKKTVVAEPAEVKLIKGKKYLWCACGMSKKQPFCDGTHHGTKYTPLLFEAQKTGRVKLCNCKISGIPPFCDNSHLQLNER